MPVHFPGDDVFTRAHIRSAVIHAAEYGFTKDFSITDYRAGGASGRSFRLDLPLGMDLEPLDLLAAALCKASAAEDQFIGWNLRLRHDLYGFRDQSILDKMVPLAWELRHVVAQDTRTFETYLRLMTPNPVFASRGAAGRQIAGTSIVKPGNLSPDLLKLRREFFIALCQESAVLDDRVAVLLDFDLYDEAQTNAVREAIEDHLTRVSGKPGLPADYAAKWRRPAGPDLASAAPVAPILNAAPVLPDNTPLRIEKFWAPPDSGPFHFDPITSLSRAVFAENAVWFFTENTSQFDPKEASIVSIDLRTFRETRIPLRDQPGTPNSFAYATNLYVTPAQFVVACPGRYLALCERASGKWEYFPNIKPDGMFAVLDGNVFLTVKEEQAVGVLRFDLTKKTADLLASARRNPPESPLDNPALHVTWLFANEAGELVARILATEGGKSKTAYWAWVAGTHSWRESGDEKGLADFSHRMSGFTGRGMVQRPASDEARASAQLVMASLPGRQPEPGLPLLVELALPTGFAFGKNGDGQKNLLQPSEWRACPLGYVFADGGGRMFWFLPRERLDEFQKAKR